MNDSNLPNLTYRHQGSDADNMVRRSAALVRESRTRLRATEEAHWERQVARWNAMRLQSED